MWRFGDVGIWGCEDYIFVVVGIKMILLNYLGNMKLMCQGQN